MELRGGQVGLEKHQKSLFILTKLCVSYLPLELFNYSNFYLLTKRFKQLPGQFLKYQIDTFQTRLHHRRKQLIPSSQKWRIKLQHFLANQAETYIQNGRWYLSFSFEFEKPTEELSN